MIARGPKSRKVKAQGKRQPLVLIRKRRKPILEKQASVPPFEYDPVSDTIDVRQQPTWDD